ncbi:MAG TPA: hypothetical protein DCM87_01995 [Planctomycetes bacterium]|nr:hypothetical protein [Planctomycetota bacterium]
MRKFGAAFVLSLAIAAAVLFFLMRADTGIPDGAGVPAGDRDATAAQPAAAPAAAVPAAAETTADPFAESGVPSVPSLYGRVTDEDDRGIPGAEVAVIAASGGAGIELFARAGDGMQLLRDRILGKAAAESGWARVAEAVTDDSGAYAIPLASIPPGDYAALARHDDHAPLGLAWTRTEESSRLDFMLGPGDWIEGVVSDQRGRPMAGARVLALVSRPMRGPMGGGEELVDQTASGRDGFFRLTVPPGMYRVSASARGCLEASAHDVASGTRDLALVLPPSAGVLVTVTDASRKPLAGARVSLYLGETFPGRGGPGGRGFGGPGGRGFGGPGGEAFTRLMQSPHERGETGKDGTCRFVDVLQAVFTVFIERAGFVSESRRGRIEGASAAVEVAVELQAGVVLAGVVLDPKGAPVSGAFVAAGEFRPEDAERRQAFERMRRGRGQDGGNAAPAETPGAAPRPEPVALFDVSAAVETDKAGRFSFDTLRAGQYSISVQADRYAPFRADGVEAGQPRELRITLEKGGTLAGRVVARGSGQPVPGAVIEARASRFDMRRARTDDDGAFALSGFHPGPIESLQVRAQGFTAAVLENVAIAPGEETHEELIELTPSASISGTIRSRSGEPVRNARIVASPVREDEQGGRMRPGGFMRDAAQTAQGRSDAAGAFVLADAPTEKPLQIAISHPDYAAFRSESFTLSPGEQRGGLEYILSEGASLRVLVRDSAGVPVPQVNVSLRREADEGAEGGRGRQAFGPGGPGGRGGATRMTGTDGRTRFAGLEGGAYSALCAPETYQPFTARVMLVEEHEAGLDIVLLPENAIAGIVRDRDGVPIEGAELSAFGQAGGRGSNAMSDANGWFRLGSLGEGPYTVRARCEGFAEASLPEVKVNIEIAVVLARTGGLRGIVLLARTGERVTSFRVRLSSTGADGSQEDGGRGRFRGPGGGMFFPREFSSPDGSFEIDGVAPGTYYLEAAAEGLNGRQVIVTVVEGEVTEGIVVPLEDGLSVAGYVTGKRGPLAGAEVYVVAVPRDERRAGRTPEKTAGAVPARLEKAVTYSDETGVFTLRELPPGAYDVIVHHGDFLPETRRVEIRDDGVAKEIRTALEDGLSLSGTVRAGAAVPFAVVTVQDARGLTKTAAADENGRYEVRGLAPGTYSYSVRVNEGERPQGGRITIKRGANRFDIKLR